jgi:curved DNA-binding protein CbpA
MSTQRNMNIQKLRRDSIPKMQFLITIILFHFTTTLIEPVYSNPIPHQFQSNDYYKVLGLTKRFAPKRTIKKAYHQLALKYHPDKIKSQNDNDEKQCAETIFIKISEAYDVLGDKKLKNIYDKYGKSGLAAYKGGMDPEEAGFGTSGGTRSDSRNGFNFKFNDGYHNSPPRQQTRHSSSDKHSYEFHFSSSGSNFNTEFIGDWNRPASIMVAIFMILVMLFVVSLVFALSLGTCFFPITIYLIWRWRRNRRTNSSM